MTFGDFKTMVAAFLQRDATTFVYGSFDWLSHAVNMARKASERQRDFEMCRTRAQITLAGLTVATPLSGAKLVDSPSTSVSVKVIKKAWVTDAGATLDYPIRVISREAFVGMASRTFADHTFTRAATIQAYTENPTTAPMLVREADDVYLTPANVEAYGSATPTVKMDIIKWLPDYSAAGDTDFLLTHCVEYMLFKTVSLLQPFLKEDIRVPLALEQLKMAWRSVVAYDSQLVSAASSVDPYVE